MTQKPMVARMMIWQAVMPLSFLFRLKILVMVWQTLMVSQAARFRPSKKKQGVKDSGDSIIESPTESGTASRTNAQKALARHWIRAAQS